MPIDRPPETSAVAHWRHALREDLRHRDALARLQQVAAAAALGVEPATALQDALAPVAALGGARHAMILGWQAQGLRVLASSGGCLPPGQVVPGARTWACVRPDFPHAFEHGALEDGWILPGHAGPWQELRLPLRRLRRVLGVLLLAREVRFGGDDPQLPALQLAAGLLAGLLAPASPTRARRGPEQTRVDRLTPRERQVLALIPSGLGNRELAQRLGIGAGTVKTHIERILQKLDCRDRAAAAALAVRAGLDA